VNLANCMQRREAKREQYIRPSRKVEMYQMSSTEEKSIPLCNHAFNCFSASSTMKKCLASCVKRKVFAVPRKINCEVPKQKREDGTRICHLNFPARRFSLSTF